MYRNALRDNFRRFMDANDAEMRLYAKQYADMYRPEGQYAAAEAGAATLYPEMADDMSNVVFNEDGSYYIIGGPDDPNMYQKQPVAVAPTEHYYEPEETFDNTNRKKRIIESLMAD